MTCRQQKFCNKILETPVVLETSPRRPSYNKTIIILKKRHDCKRDYHVFVTFHFDGSESSLVPPPWFDVITSDIRSGKCVYPFFDQSEILRELFRQSQVHKNYKTHYFVLHTFFVSTTYTSKQRMNRTDIRFM